MEYEDINFSPLLRALAKFDAFRMNNGSEQEQAGTIQAFEYCFELVWKLMKRVLEVRGKISNSPRETFRLAALEGLIDDPEVWFDFLKKRNLTVHSYNPEEACSVLGICASFSHEVKIFLSRTHVAD